jgi:hypothetical protein
LKKNIFIFFLLLSIGILVSGCSPNSSYVDDAADKNSTLEENVEARVTENFFITGFT